MTRRIHYFGLRSAIPLEAAIWMGGLILLALTDSALEHVGICPLSRLGLDFCPGCGLGRSVSLLLHGDIAGSLSIHPLGIPAALILTGRVLVLLRNGFRRPPFPVPTHHVKG